MEIKYPRTEFATGTSATLLDTLLILFATVKNAIAVLPKKTLA